MNGQQQAVRHLVLVAGLVPTAWAFTAQAQEFPHVRGRLIAILALPASMAGKVTPDTRYLALEIASRLRVAGAQVVVAGVDAQVPLEELTFASNSSGPDATIAVLSLGPSKKCAACITTERLPKPPQSDGVIGKDELARMVNQAFAWSRAEASANLAGILAAVVRSCPRKATDVERYILRHSNSPTVILSLSSSDANGLLAKVPGALEQWLAMEQK